MAKLSGFLIGSACGWALCGAWITTLSVRELATCVVIIAAGFILRELHR
jgi:hypothetical protein